MELKEALEFFVSDNFPKSLEVYLLSSTEIENLRMKNMIVNISQTSSLVIDQIARLNPEDPDIDDLLHYKNELKFLTSNQHSRINSITSCMGTIYLFLKNLSDKLKQDIFTFHANEVTDSATLKALDDYINVGALIKDQNSLILREINELVKEKGRFEKLVNDCKLVGGASADSFFIAIVGPSFYGKTQLAFAFPTQRPLYFALDQTRPNCQKIYLNYRNLNLSLKKFGSSDFAEMSELNKKKQFVTGDNIKDLDFSLISLNSIESFFYTFKFRILGFLSQLLQDSYINFDEASSVWMRFHSRRTTFTFPSLSIDQFLETPDLDAILSKYFVFLDEFCADPWAVLVRNLCRVVKLICIVASTNSKITNLIGDESSKFSRGDLEEKIVYNVVINRLPPVLDPDILIMLYDLDELFTLMVGSKLENLGNYLKSQLKTLRPGLSCLLCSVIKSAITFQHGVFDLVDLIKIFDKILKEFWENLFGRKKTLKNSVSGRAGTLAMTSIHAFKTENPANKPKIQKLPTFLNDHLYFVSNPVGNSDWCFTIFAPCTKIETLSIFSGSTLKKWKPWTFLDRKEEILILCLLYYGYDRTVAAVVENIFTTLSIENPMVCSREDGYCAELRSLNSVIDASHYADSDRTIGGISGETFLKNIYRNLIDTYLYEDDRKPAIKMNWSSRNELVKFFRNVQVPFLYVAGLDYSPLFLKMFHADIKMFGTVSHPSNSSQIDGKFDFYFKNCKMIGGIEVKDRMKNLTLSNYLKIVEKGLKNGTKIHFTFCNSFSSIMYEESLNDFKRLHIGSRCNFYHVLRDGDQFSCSINPIFANFFAQNRVKIPEHVFFVFQFNNINDK